jgi:hypothetical protein
VSASRYSSTAEAWLLVLLGGPWGKTARGPSCLPSLWFGGLWPKGWILGFRASKVHC